MRTDNRGVKNFIISVYFILIVAAVLLATVFKSFDVLTDSSLYVFGVTLLIAVLVHAIARYCSILDQTFGPIRTPEPRSPYYCVC